MPEKNMSLTVFDPIKATLAELQKKDFSLVFDHTTPEGEKDLRSWVKRIRGFKGDVARAHKDTKAEALAFGRQVDTLKNELTAGADKLITERMKPLDEIEAKKRAEAEAIIEAERVAKEKKEAEELAELNRREAEVAKKEVEIREKERIEREKNISAEAAEKAKEEAERIASNRAKVAEQEKAEAVETEKEKARQAEKERIEREKQIAVESAENARKEAEQRARAKAATERLEKQQEEAAKKRRVENVRHRDKIENEIIGCLRKYISTEELAAKILIAIKHGQINHVTINY